MHPDRTCGGHGQARRSQGGLELARWRGNVAARCSRLARGFRSVGSGQLTALCGARRFCFSVRIPQLLLKNGCDANIGCNLGRTPLHRAAALGDKSSVTALLNSHEVELDLQDNTEMTPLHIATIQAMRATGTTRCTQHLAVVEALIAAGASDILRDAR